jgi:outer membrane biosynthesis protein TonB
MRKAIIAGAAAAAIAPGLIVTPPVAHATGECYSGGNQAAASQCAANLCMPFVRAGDMAGNQRCILSAIAAPPRQTQVPPSRVPVQTPQAPPKAPTYAPPSPMPVQTPQVKPPPPPPAPTTVPVVTPKINPPAPGAPRNASRVTPPKGVDAPQQAVTAAKSAPPTRVNPVTPPKPPTQVDFNQQVQHVTSTHLNNVGVVKAGNQALIRPRHWSYVDYDVYHRPALYNPLTEAMTFRYFYDGAYREVYVPAGGRSVLDVATTGVFPFSAVGDSYVASGSFTGGAWVPPDGWDGPPPPDYTPPPDPTVYQDVSADVPADNQTVQVGQVTVVGHDDSLPAGSQDGFLLDDSTLAWGHVNDPGGPTQITVTKTQSMPGVSPKDDGSYLVALATHEQPTDNNTWWLWPLGGAVLVIAAGLVTWMVIRRKRIADL